MKKSYVSPFMAEVNVEAAQMLATSVQVFGDKEVDTSVEGNQLGGSSRGEWGNLWSK